VSYVDEGKLRATPIIFIHGFPFDKSTWEEQMEALQPDYRVIAYDVRGHGDSNPGMEEFSIQLFTDDLFLFMDALNIEKAILCGLSMGGYIALQAIKQEPLRISGLILADTQCFADTEEAKEKRFKTVDHIRENGLKQYASDSVKKLFSETSLRDKTEIVSAIERTILKTPVDTICNTLIALAGRMETCSALPLITVPVLIFVGAEDKVTTPEAAQKIQELIPGSALRVLEKAGHLSNLEAGDSFNLHLQNFLKSEFPKPK
jgi:pimeloyl-ACP methyl ester carboxylesterase